MIAMMLCQGRCLALSAKVQCDIFDAYMACPVCSHEDIKCGKRAGRTGRKTFQTVGERLPEGAGYSPEGD